MENNKLSRILSGKNDNYYIIGETAYNHEGDLKYLYKTVDGIAELKLDAVKFHLMLNVKSYMQEKHHLFDEASEWLFSEEDWKRLIEHSNGKGLEVIALCDDVDSIEFILKNKIQVAGIELHMSCLNDYFMMEKLAEFSGPIILGIGGSEPDEVDYALEFFRKKGRKNLLLMYGFQNYPTNYEEINLRKMLSVEEKFKVAVGYADHTAFDNENNELITVAPYLLGIRIFEKHYTPDWGKERIDYQSAIGKKQFMKIREYLDLYKKVLGDGNWKMPPAELEYGKIGPMKKAIVAREKIKKGQKIELKDLWYKRTEEEVDLKQNRIWEIVGKKAEEDIELDEVVTLKKISKE